jgi:hypothetical protein
VTAPPTYQVPAPPAGYCGRCGTPFGPGAGQFCRICGNRVRSQPPVATNYTYPAMPTASVPAAQHKIGPTGLVVIIAASLFLLVAIITVVAVSNKPGLTYCHFSCGPDFGPRLYSRTAYSNSAFGFRVEYEQPFDIEAQTSSGVEFGSNMGYIQFNATRGSNVDAAIQSAANGVDTNEFQDLTQVSSSIPGAQIGFVQGSGIVLRANYVPSGGGSSEPAVIMIIAATQGNMTMSVLAAGGRDLSSPEQQPFGMSNGFEFDFELTNTIWPGQ